MTVVLPAPLGPTSAIRRPGSSLRSKRGQHRRLAGRIAGGHAFERDGRRELGHGTRPVRIPDRRLPVGQLEHAPAGRDRGRELDRGRAQRQDAVERREREQRHASPRAPGRPSALCQDRQHAGDGQARDQDRESLGEARGERVAAAETHELVASRPDPGQRVLLAPVDDELRRAAQQLDELGGQLRASGSLATAGGSRQPRRQHGHEHAGEQEPEGENRSGGRQDRRGHDDARRSDHERDEQRRQAADVEALRARRRRRPCGRGARRAGSPRAVRARAARSARRSASGSGRAPTARRRARRGGRRTARAAVRGRRSGRRRSSPSARGSAAAPPRGRSDTRPS